jgi:glutamate formiminotransferase
VIGLVSFTLTNFHTTQIFGFLVCFTRAAARYGVTILESEIIGLIPAAALTQSAAWFLQVSDFSDRQVLENALADD